MALAEAGGLLLQLQLLPSLPTVPRSTRTSGGADNAVQRDTTPEHVPTSKSDRIAAPSPQARGASATAQPAVSHSC